MPSSPEQRFARFAWIVLAYTVAVVLWGAYVRATGSGAGCGDHWPMCNGEIVPRAPSIATLIEYTHRITSGLAWVLALGLVLAARRIFPRRHGARRFAGLALLFMTTEALVGAGLVLFQRVATDDSIARAVWMSAHLANTFFLLVVLTLAAWLASSEEPYRLRVEGPRVGVFAGAFLVMLAIGMSGAVAALGDTLFPPASLAKGLAEDFSPTAHFLVRLRILHPILAIAGGAYLLFTSGGLAVSGTSERVRRAAAWVAGLVLLQIGAGFLNLSLLAPVLMQLVHLFLADLLLIALTVSAAVSLEAPRNTHVPVESGESRASVEDGRAQGVQVPSTPAASPDTLGP